MNEMPSKAELAADARGLVRRALKASLATIASGSSYPRKWPLQLRERDCTDQVSPDPRNPSAQAIA